MIELVCDKNRAFFRETEKLTSGSIGVTINFVFSPEWDGLLKTAVFDAGEAKIDVVLTSESCEVPPEVLACPGKQLSVGVFGELADKTLVIPTIYAEAGIIRPGASPSGMSSAPPTPSWPEQVQAIAIEAKEAADSVRSAAEAGKFNGPAGEAGGFYTPAVTQPDANTIRMSFTPSKEDMPAVAETDITLPAGGGGGGSSIAIDETLTEQGMAADAKATGDAIRSLSEEIANIPSGGSGLTTAQVNALDGMFKVCAFTKDNVSAEYTAFKTAFGIADSGGESGGDDSGDGGETDVTLTSISATYDGGDVAVGTAVTDLTGIVVTAHYSDGSTATVTGYAISGEISEGENTITVTYQGKTATFTVTGIAESSGENNGWADGEEYAIEWARGYGINSSTGENEEVSGRAASDYLPCHGVGMVELSNIYTNYGIFYYAEDKTFISRSGTVAVVDANRKDVRRNAYFIRVQTTTPDTASVVPHILPVLDDKTAWESGVYYIVNWLDNKEVNTNTGATVDRSGFTCSDFALCYGATSLQFSESSRVTVAWYDSDKQFLSTEIRQNRKTALTVPDGAAYFRFVTGTAGVSNYWVQLT